MELYVIHHPSAEKILNITSFTQWTKATITRISYCILKMVVFLGAALAR